MPNASIPNGDRINDNFKVSGIGLQSVDMTIYSWGQIVFQQSAIHPFGMLRIKSMELTAKEEYMFNIVKAKAVKVSYIC